MPALRAFYSCTGRRRRAALLERAAEEEDDRPQKNHEHGREDQQYEWEQNLDGGLLRALLGGRAAPFARLGSEVPHDLADRDTERLALEHRAHERSHRRRVAAREHVRERLVRRQAHRLLLQTEPKLVPEGAFHAFGRLAQRTTEPEAGFDADDEQVDELGEIELDPLEAPMRAALEHLQRRPPSPVRRERQEERAEEARREPEPCNREAKAADEAIARELAHRDRVDAGRHQRVPKLPFAGVADSRRSNGAETARDRVESAAQEPFRFADVQSAPRVPIRVDLREGG